MKVTGTVLSKTGLGIANQVDGPLRMNMMALVHSMQHHYKGRLYVGLFDVDNPSDVYGNIDVSCFSSIGGIPDDEVDDGDVDIDPNEIRALDDEGIEDTDTITEQDAVDGTEVSGANIVDEDSEIDKLEKCLSKEALWTLSSDAVSNIPFQSKELEGLLNDLADSMAYEHTPDSFYWYPNIEDPRLESKFVNIMFLDGTFLQKGEYATLLTLAGITTDHRTVPIAHMLHKNGENMKHTVAFLSLTKRHLKFKWENFQIMCDQSRVLENSVHKVFGGEPLTCGLHLLKNVVKRTCKNVYRFFNVMS